jgi:outer membrane protein assembly factor BamB
VGAVAIILAAAFWFQHKSLGISILLYGIPVAIIVVALVSLLTNKAAWPAQRWVLLAAWAIPIFAWMPLRSEGFMASFMPQLRWRWTPDAETIALQEAQAKLSSGQGNDLKIMQVNLQPGDWPRFRGMANDGQVGELSFNLNDGSNLKLLWRKAACPSWGTVIIVDGYLFTMEQRGSDEIVLCRDATTGDECWAHSYPARFEDTTQVSGVGPRGTPTFHDGKLFSVGARGHVSAIQATDGNLLWQRELVEDTIGSVPMWGFSTSPYADDTVCIVMSNSEAGKSVDTICYDSKSGEIVWKGEEGGSSYSSPQVVDLLGTKQVLVSLARQSGGKKGNLLLSRDYKTGQELWRYEGDFSGNAMLTPIVVGKDRILITNGAEGVSLIELSPSDGQPQPAWSTKSIWSQNRLLPEFSDLIVQSGMVLGLSKGLLTALNLEDGKQLWKKLRFGGGQLIGLALQETILALSEEGKLSLIRVSKAGPKVLFETDAISGKTWNHPVIVGNRIYCRNYEEIACFELTTPGN